ncbi:MAG: MBL fold metallo-hydrolase [Labilithrix sp.]|nr:MBL fold metallo-hydrolase [Labilithrix sp.]MCW5811146.1 MBL fold metallo-hydrolase [Labilithrix sp.]
MRPEVFAVTDTVTCIRRPSYFTCSYVVRSEHGVLLVDAGMKSDGSDVLVALEGLGLEPSSVRAIFITHWHNDHAAGAGELAERSGARVVCLGPEAPYLRRDTATGGVLGWLSDAVPEVGPFVLAKGLLGSAPMRAVTPTDIMSDGDDLFGLRVIATPGHTEGHAAYYWEEAGMLFAGDALAFIDGELRFMARSVTPDLAAARASMLRVLELPFRYVCPGHREPGPVDDDERARFARVVAAGSWPFLG